MQEIKMENNLICKRTKYLLLTNRCISKSKNLYSNILILLITLVLSTNLLYCDIVIPFPGGRQCAYGDRPMGQSFTITSASVITSFTIDICYYDGVPPKNYTLNIFAGDTNAGTPLYTQNFSYSVSVQGVKTITLTTPLTVSSGKYTVIFSNICLYRYTQDTYTGGDLWDGGAKNTTYDLNLTIGCTTLANATLTSTTVTSIASSSASSGGNISSDGGATVTARGVVWNTSANPTIALSTKTSDGTGTGAFTSSITGLSPVTTYYYRAYATNSVGTSYGSESSFTTIAATPTVSSTTANTITSSSASSGGNISTNGGAAVTARGVVWSTSTSPTIALSTRTNDGTGSGVFTSNLTGLTPATTYYYRAYSTNTMGTSYGSELSFTTLPTTASLTSTVASSITGTTATSGGNISSDGGASVTARGVVWSTSINPTVVLGTKTNDGAGNGAFTSSITGLNFNTTYYYRAYATNSAGTSYGNETSFTTNASAIVTLDIPTNLTANKIIISATASSDGGAAITERGIILSKVLNATITIATKHIDSGTGLGTYSSTFSDLTSGTRYYLRSYAINTDGISYSDNSAIYTIDNDGVSETDENKAPNGDGNGDGIADASQENVVSLVGLTDNIVTIASPNAAQILNTSNYEGPTNGSYSYPFGVFNYTINASSATVTMYFHGTSSLRNYVYRKLSATGRWVNFDNATFSYTTINHETVATATLVLTDGDPASDADGIVNGIIVDPGGPALLVSDASNIPVWDWKYAMLLMCLIGVSVFKFKN